MLLLGGTRPWIGAGAEVWVFGLEVEVVRGAWCSEVFTISRWDGCTEVKEAD